MRNKPGNGKEVLKSTLTGMAIGGLMGVSVHPDKPLHWVGGALLGGAVAAGLGELGDKKENESRNKNFYDSHYKSRK
jgi:hypothetical protein